MARSSLVLSDVVVGVLAASSQAGVWAEALRGAGAVVRLLESLAGAGRPERVVVAGHEDVPQPPPAGIQLVTIADEEPVRPPSAQVRMLLRPVSPGTLVEAVRRAWLRAAVDAPGVTLDAVTAAALKRTRLPVLLLGETGTGKTHAARQLHQWATPERPFVEVNVAALTPTLFASELFGHERGAFTGAVAAKQGLVEVASGGTLFLDEVGELAPESQAQLLSYLDTGRYRTVGGVRERTSTARVVAATNRELAREVDEGRFRADLYQRLASVVVSLRPLRERRDEIPALVEKLCEETSERLGLGRPRITPGALAVMRTLPLRGNVRELRFLVERVCATWPGETVDEEHLASLAAPARTSARVPDGTVRPLAEVEREAVLRAIASTGGNRTAAARLLGITPRGLYNKLRRIERGEPAPRVVLPLRTVG